MPLTVLQKQVLRILAANRSEESHFAGGLVLNAGEESPRYSHDFDIFHEAEAEVARASDLDVLSLRSAGYEVHQTGGDWKNPVGFRKARLIHGGRGSRSTGRRIAPSDSFPSSLIPCWAGGFTSLTWRRTRRWRLPPGPSRATT